MLVVSASSSLIYLLQPKPFVYDISDMCKILQEISNVLKSQESQSKGMGLQFIIIVAHVLYQSVFLYFEIIIISFIHWLFT